MKKSEVAKADVIQLVAAYKDAAMLHGEATEKGDHKTANAMADRIAAIYSELRRRGSAAQEQLLPLLEGHTAGVRLWAASHALEFASREGERVLASLAAENKLIGLSADTTLKEWRAGRLRFP